MKKSTKEKLQKFNQLDDESKQTLYNHLPDWIKVSVLVSGCSNEMLDKVIDEEHENGNFKFLNKLKKQLKRNRRVYKNTKLNNS